MALLYALLTYLFTIYTYIYMYIHIYIHSIMHILDILLVKAHDTICSNSVQYIQYYT